MDEQVDVLMKGRPKARAPKQGTCGIFHGDHDSTFMTWMPALVAKRLPRLLHV